MRNKSHKITFNVVVCGNYGATNLGDEAILDSILKLVNEAFFSSGVERELNTTVLSANPESTTEAHGIYSEYLFPAGFRSFFRGLFRGTIRRTMDTLRNADLFILGGGGLFTDEKTMAVLIWSLQARIARLYGVPVVCLGQSVGPLKTFFGRNMTKNVFRNAYRVTVRDRKSADLLAELGIKNVTELADPVFALAKEAPAGVEDVNDISILHGDSFKAEDMDFAIDSRPEKLAVFSVRPWIGKQSESFYDSLAAFIVWLKRKHGVKSVLVPFQIIKDNDLDCMNTILDRIKIAGLPNKDGKSRQNEPDNVFNDEGDIAEIYEYGADYNKIIELMSRSEFVCGMRLHSLIFSALAGCPFIGVSYSSKVRESAKKMGMEEFVIDLNKVTLDNLKGNYERIKTHSPGIRSLLMRKTAGLKSKAIDHESFLSDLIRSLC